MRQFRDNKWRSYLGILACVLFTMASKPSCAPTNNARECGVTEVRLVPGDCVDLPNLCDGDWDRLARLNLCDTLSTVWFEVTRRPGSNTVRMCADADIDIVSGRELYVWITTTDDSSYAITYDVSTGEAPEATSVSGRDH